MSGMTSRCGSLTVLALVVATLVAGCSSNSAPYYPPVEDRGIAVNRAPSTPWVDDATKPAPEVRVLPGAENAGKPGYYTVRPGDTMIRIALETGQNWKDLARWNALENPNLIEVGQVVRVIPPPGQQPMYSSTHAVTGQTLTETASGVVVSRPVTSGSATPTKTGTRVTAAASTGATTSTSSITSATTEDEPVFIWPSSGALLAGFDETKNKGLDLGGKVGDPVLAAANGRVVYAGSGLRGYGNLVILKHNNTYLTAYAHNQTVLVKEDQAVRKGQKIAEMGSSDADRVKLHFEVRRLGKPVDPAKYLPPR